MDTLEPPAKKTLRQYGMTAADWLELVARQDWRCALCRKPLKRPNVDHLHVRRYAKLAPEQRRRLVRGVIDAACNRWLLGPLRYGYTAESYEKAAAYLRDFQRRLDTR